MTGVPSGVADALDRLNGQRHALTIGNFDGVHRGHQHLLSRVTSRAAEAGVASLVVTFEPHPVSVLRPEHAPPRLSTPDMKIAYLHAVGIDDVVVLPFTRELAALSPEEFLSAISDAACPTDIFVGEGFRFGKMRAGDIETIRRFGETRGFRAHSVEPLTDDQGVISSTRVREALLEGHIDTATDLLGRRYRLRGTVEHGMARGRDLGYPTANLQIGHGMCIPQDGIYVGYAHLDERSHGPREALIYIGSSPTFGDTGRKVEVYILDYQGDLYSQTLEVEFIAFVRPDRTFASADELTQQIEMDEATSREILASTEPDRGLKGD